MTPETLSRLKRQEYAHYRRAIGLGCEADRFDPVAMFDRDGWICWICGQPIDPNARGEGAPSIDHRPALASGGAHTLAGTRASHLGCNLAQGRKEDTGRAAKTKRQARLSGQQARRAAGKTAKIKSRGFPSKDERRRIKAEWEARRGK